MPSGISDHVWVLVTLRYELQYHARMSRSEAIHPPLAPRTLRTDLSERCNDVATGHEAQRNRTLRTDLSDRCNDVTTGHQAQL